MTSEERKKQPQPFRLKSVVIAEFVDEIPTPKGNLQPTRFEAQPGFKEGMMKAMQNPGHAMKILTYNEGPKSKRRANAKFRAEKIIAQGYNEDRGWTVKAVDSDIYVMYDPRGI